MTISPLKPNLGVASQPHLNGLEEPKLPRVLHLIDSGGIYGIERMLLALLPALQVLGYPVALGCFGVPGTTGGAVGEAAAELGVETLFFDFRSRTSLRGVADVTQAIARSPRTILHFHGYKATIIGGVASQLFRRIRIATYHGEANQSVGLDRYIAIESPIIRRLHAVAAVSEPIAEELRMRGVAPGRVHVIPNGIPDPRVLHHSNTKTFTLAIIGRLIPEKNIHLLLQSVATLRPAWPHLRVVIAGDGPYRLELERLAGELNLTESVTFLGFVSDVPRLLAQADAFVMPSQTEGMPISLLEAMAVGVPIIASAVGSIPAVTRHLKEGLLIPPNDSRALVTAIELLLNDPAGAQSRAANAKARFLGHFTSEAMARAYSSLYKYVSDER